MDTTYTEFFKLATKHSNFVDSDAFNSLQIGTPFGQSIPSLQHVKREGEVVFFGKDVPSVTVTEPTILPLHIKDPIFLNYTQLDLNLTSKNHPHIGATPLWPTKAFWLDTEKVETAIVDGKITYPLTNGAEYLLPVDMSHFSIRCGKQGVASSDTWIQLKSETGFRDLLTLDRQGFVEIDLRNEPEGRYELEVSWGDDKEVETYSFLAFHNPPSTPALAFLSFDVSGNLLSNNGFALSKPTIELTFEARSVFWKYNVIYRSLKDDTSIQEKVEWSGTGASPAGVEFQAEERKVENGNTVDVFKSNQPLPLQERYNYYASLRMDDMPEHPMQLPWPSSEHIRPVQSPIGETVFLAEMFVYV